jgi:bis(5'-nucleosyl)-tetraphosphatase (symmetrical)
MNYQRTIIYGDIHGCLDELMISLEQLKFDPAQDRLIFAGDLIDRGPDSGGVVNFAKNHEAVCGNHDDKHIRYHKHALIKRENPHYKNPVNLSEDKRRTHSQLSDDDLQWLGSLPKKIYLEKEHILVVHAGVLPFGSPFNQRPDVYMYCRYLHKDTYRMVNLGPDFKQSKDSVLWADVYDGDVNIVYGHNVHNKEYPYTTINKKGIKTWGLDTGCVFGGKLTAMIISNANISFHQTIAKMNYYKR